MKYTKKDFDNAVAQALKVAGKDAEVPAPQVDPMDGLEEATKTLTELNKARNDMLKKIEDYENAIGKIRNAVKGYVAKIAKDKCGLDESKPDDKKKIVQVRKILTDSMHDLDKQCQDSLKSVDGLEKSLSGNIT